MGILLDSGADIDATNDGELTALHLAVRYQKPDAVKTLIERGANVLLRDTENLTPLYLAIRKDIEDPVNKQIIDLLEPAVERAMRCSSVQQNQAGRHQRLLQQKIILSQYEAPPEDLGRQL